MSFFTFFIQRIDMVIPEFIRHINLTLLAIVFSVSIGVPIGLFLVRFPKIARPTQYFLSILQTIPSLALLGFLIPIVGIGVKPSIIALVLYSLLVIVQNTVVGVQQVDKSVLESAVGIGMNKIQVLFQVQIPLALPVIIAGIRVASVTCVGIATITAAVGAGGLGSIIFRGIAVIDGQLILLGAIPAALLAIIFDSIFIIIEKILKK